MQVVFVLDKNGRKTRLIVKNGEVVYESQSLEAIAFRLDLMACLIKIENENV